MTAKDGSDQRQLVRTDTNAARQANAIVYELGDALELDPAGLKSGQRRATAASYAHGRDQALHRSGLNVAHWSGHDRPIEAATQGESAEQLYSRCLG